MNGAYRNLSMVIIIQAARDWRLAMRKLRTNSKSNINGKQKYAEFFRSVWLEELISLDGKRTILKRKEEANENDA